eukprot:m51a1_g1750 hypothetical protein (321) ;mRNA; r:220673-222116
MEAEVEELKKSYPGLSNRELSGHQKRVHAVAWNCSGTRLASCSADNTIRIWSPDKDQSIMELKGHTASVEAIAWDPRNADVLASVSVDNSLRLWDVSKAPGRQVAVDQCDTSLLMLCWSPDGENIVVADKDDTVRWLERKGGSLRFVKSIKFGSSLALNDVKWHPNGRLIFLAANQSLIEIVQFPSFARFHTLQTASKQVDNITVQFDPNSKYFALGSSDGACSLWDAREWACLRVFHAAMTGVRSISFSCDSKLIAVGSDDASVDVSHVESGTLIYQQPVPLPEPVTYSVAFNPRQPLVVAFTRKAKDQPPIVIHGLKA